MPEMVIHYFQSGSPGIYKYTLYL